MSNNAKNDRGYLCIKAHNHYVKGIVGADIKLTMDGEKNG